VRDRPANRTVGGTGGAQREAGWCLALVAIIVGAVLLDLVASDGARGPSPNPALEHSGAVAPLSDGSQAAGGVDAGSLGAAPDDAGTPREVPIDARVRDGSNELYASLPVVERAYAAAKRGRWREAVRWLDEALAGLPPGRQRNRVATLRVHLIMENAPRVEGALALASLLSDAATAMATGRFAGADAADANLAPEDRALFVGPFVVAAPESGWVRGGDALAGIMVGHAQNLGRRDAAHLRSQDAYLASLAPFVESAIAESPNADAGTRDFLEATRAFIELNERIRREGGDRVRTWTTAPLGESVASFVRARAASPDERTRSLVRFLFAAFPNWAQRALDSPREGG